MNDFTLLSTNEVDKPTETEEEEILYMELDCRRPEWVKNQVTEGEVCNALLLENRDDPTKGVKAMWGAALVGLFKIESKDFSQYVGKSLVIRREEIKLKPVRKRRRNRYAFNQRRPNQYDQEKRKGLLVTIYDSYELRYRDISNELFDQYFLNLGVEIIKQTRPQFCRGSREVFNTNR